MVNSRNRFYVGAAILAIASIAQADVIVCPPTGDRTPDWDAAEVNGEWEITLLDNDGFGGVWYIYSDESGVDNIRWIKVECDDGGTTEVRITDGTDAPDACVDPCSGCYVNNVGSVTELGTSNVLLARALLTGNLGDVTVWGIHTIDIDGDITGDITTDVSITLIDAGGDILGDVTAGTALLRMVAGGTIGTSGSPITVDVSTYVHEIEGTSVHANITAGTDYGRLETTNGNFTGSLSADIIKGVGGFSDIVIDGGDLDANITVETDLQTDIYIDNNLDGNITLGNGAGDDDPLIGQIIINVANSTGAWNGNVTIDGTALSPKGDYTNLLSGDIGGGAVGLATFNYYGLDCDPVEGATETSNPSSVLLRHYGPVRYDGSGMPITIERRAITTPIEPPGSWVDVTANFEVSISGTDVTITPKDGYSWASPFDYRIKPVTTGSASDRLNCDQVDSNPAVDVYTYTFSVDV